MTVHEPGKAPSTSHTIDAIHDADVQDPSIICELTLIGGEWGIISLNQTTPRRSQGYFRPRRRQRRPGRDPRRDSRSSGRRSEQAQHLSDRLARTTTSR
jgi:hypothetical protein